MFKDNVMINYTYGTYMTYMLTADYLGTVLLK